MRAFLLVASSSNRCRTVAEDALYVFTRYPRTRCPCGPQAQSRPCLPPHRPLRRAAPLTRVHPKAGSSGGPTARLPLELLGEPVGGFDKVLGDSRLVRRVASVVDNLEVAARTPRLLQVKRRASLCHSQRRVESSQHFVFVGMEGSATVEIERYARYGRPRDR